MTHSSRSSSTLPYRPWASPPTPRHMLLDAKECLNPLPGERMGDTLQPALDEVEEGCPTPRGPRARPRCLPLCRRRQAHRLAGGRAQHARARGARRARCSRGWGRTRRRRARRSSVPPASTTCSSLCRASDAHRGRSGTLPARHALREWPRPARQRLGRPRHRRGGRGVGRPGARPGCAGPPTRGEITERTLATSMLVRRVVAAAAAAAGGDRGSGGGGGGRRAAAARRRRRQPRRRRAAAARRRPPPPRRRAASGLACAPGAPRAEPSAAASCGWRAWRRTRRCT